MSAPVTSQIDWRGVAISISYHRHQWAEFDHIEVNVIGDGIIPITETGYRSHYQHSDVTDEYGGAVAFVLAWLEHEAQTPQWKKQEEAAQNNRGCVCVCGGALW